MRRSPDRENRPFAGKVRVRQLREPPFGYIGVNRYQKAQIILGNLQFIFGDARKCSVYRVIRLCNQACATRRWRATVFGWTESTVAISSCVIPPK
jgi:hypothetical protein